MPISSATRPSQLVGASNGPIRWGEAMRIRGLGPSFLSSPSWVNRAEEALDASPHPNGLDDLGAIGLGTKWDGPKADSSRVYEAKIFQGGCLRASYTNVPGAVRPVRWKKKQEGNLFFSRVRADLNHKVSRTRRSCFS